jgi:hypothetical protein
MTEVEFTIVDMDNKVALKNGIGRDVAWGNLDYPDYATDAEAEAFKSAFETVKNGSDDYFHTDGDTYQGSTFMRVIRRKADGRLFGFSYWEGGGKYGEAMIEPNGDEHGFPSEWDDEEGTTTKEWYVFLPVVEKPLPAYVFEEEA